MWRLDDSKGGCSQRSQRNLDITIILLTENSFHASYLVTKWLDAVGRYAGFAGIALRADPLPESLRAARRRFHQHHQGMRVLTRTLWEYLRELYPEVGDTEQAMIRSFGVPARSVDDYMATTFVGRQINDQAAESWLSKQCGGPRRPFFFVFLDAILAEWWIERTGSRIINGHSAVLPYARGMFAIEQIAATRDVERFEASVGATAHYIDSGVDTGPIIRSERFMDAFAFDSIWDCKGHSFMTTFNLLVSVALDITASYGKLRAVPVGTAPRVEVSYDPSFKKAEFTIERRSLAESGFLAMKRLKTRHNTE